MESEEFLSEKGAGLEITREIMEERQSRVEVQEEEEQNKTYI